MKYTIKVEDESATVTHDDVDAPLAMAHVSDALIALNAGDSVTLTIDAS